MTSPSNLSRDRDGTMAKLRVLDLFSGVGAYSLGLERTGGFQTVAFCEIEEYPRKILRKHWPDVRIYEDVRELSADRLAADGIVPQWIVAGWPCQDISLAGTGSGLDGARSGLWGEIARLAGELGVEGLLLENSSNLLGINGGADFGRVLGDLAALGFDAEWHCLPAAAFDAPHIRDRLWIVARKRGASADTSDNRHKGGARRGDVAQADGAFAGRPSIGTCRPRIASDANSLSEIGAAIARRERHTWDAEPRVGRVATGIANRAHRIAALGNLNPPIVPYTIGRAILEARAAA